MFDDHVWLIFSLNQKNKRFVQLSRAKDHPLSLMALSISSTELKLTFFPFSISFLSSSVFLIKFSFIGLSCSSSSTMFIMYLYLSNSSYSVFEIVTLSIL